MSKSLVRGEIMAGTTHEMVLRVLYHHNNGLVTFDIEKQLEGFGVTINALHVGLKDLSLRDLVERVLVYNPNFDRGPSRVYKYSITEEGRAALYRVQERQLALWDKFPLLAMA